VLMFFQCGFDDSGCVIEEPKEKQNFNHDYHSFLQLG